MKKKYLQKTISAVMAILLSGSVMLAGCGENTGTGNGTSGSGTESGQTSGENGQGNSGDNSDEGGQDTSDGVSSANNGAGSSDGASGFEVPADAWLVENQVPAYTTATGRVSDNHKGEAAESGVIFSHESGIYESGFVLSLSLQDGYKEIRYTLDGSDPATSDTAVIYKDAIEITDRRGTENIVSAVAPVRISGNYNKVSSTGYTFEATVGTPEDSAVDKCTVVRAVAVNSDGEFGAECGAAYFIGTMEEHIRGLASSCSATGTSLAVISIAGDYNDFFDDETGIYVKGDAFTAALNEYLSGGKKPDSGEVARSLDANYKQKGREWEREVSLTFLEASPAETVEIFNQNCGIRIQGNYSRSDLQKGFRLYAREEYGADRFNYAVFGEDYLNDEGQVMDSYKTLILRAGGNCAFTAKFNDTFWQSMCDGLHLDTQKSRPCVVYLNGEYWGLYVLEEDYSANYFADKHGVKKKDVVLYKGDAEALALGYKLDLGDLPEGETDESYYFQDLLDFVHSHDSLDDAEYAEFCEIVDPESLIDYFAMEVWINNKWDWPGKNWSMWKTLSDNGTIYGDGRWRFTVYDVEFGGVSGSSDATTNTIKEDNYKPMGLLDQNTGNIPTRCFALMMTNSTFRIAYEERLLHLSGDQFEQAAALNRLKEFEDAYGPLMDQFFERYPGSGDKENALNGGYASAKCIRSFLLKREDYVPKIVAHIERVLGD